MLTVQEAFGKRVTNVVFMGMVGWRTQAGGVQHTPQTWYLGSTAGKDRRGGRGRAGGSITAPVVPLPHLYAQVP